jgi:hypothetical protein
MQLLEQAQSPAAAAAGGQSCTSAVLRAYPAGLLVDAYALVHPLPAAALVEGLLAPVLCCGAVSTRLLQLPQRSPHLIALHLVNHTNDLAHPLFSPAAAPAASAASRPAAPSRRRPPPVAAAAPVLLAQPLSRTWATSRDRPQRYSKAVTLHDATESRYQLVRLMLPGAGCCAVSLCLQPQLHASDCTLQQLCNPQPTARFLVYLQDAHSMWGGLLVARGTAPPQAGKRPPCSLALLLEGSIRR